MAQVSLTSDCRVLLAHFEEKESVRFEDFCEVWKQMNFSLIQHVRIKEWERRQVVECLFQILSSYMQTTCPMQYQVGAIYALYSVYNTQLVTPKVQIRMTVSMWQNLLELQEKIKEQKHYDVYYIIRSLRADKAFIFVAMPLKLASGSRDAISVYEREAAKETKSSYAIRNIEESLQKIEAIDNAYKSTKVDVCSGGENRPVVDPVTLKVASDNFVPDLLSDYNDFQNWRQEHMDSMKAKQTPRPPELGLPDDRKNNPELETEKSEPVNKLTRLDRVRAIKARSCISSVKTPKR